PTSSTRSRCSRTAPYSQRGGWRTELRRCSSWSESCSSAGEACLSSSSGGGGCGLRSVPLVSFGRDLSPLNRDLGQTPLPGKHLFPATARSRQAAVRGKHP